MQRTLRNIIKSYDMITDEGAKLYKFFYIFTDEKEYRIEQDIKTLEDMRKLVKTSNSRMLDEKVCDTKAITRFLSAIIVNLWNENDGSLSR